MANENVKHLNTVVMVPCWRKITKAALSDIAELLGIAYVPYRFRVRSSIKHHLTVGAKRALGGD